MLGTGDRMAVAWRRRESHGDRFVGLGGQNVGLLIRRLRRSICGAHGGSAPPACLGVFTFDRQIYFMFIGLY